MLSGMTLGLNPAIFVPTHPGRSYGRKKGFDAGSAQAVVADSALVCVGSAYQPEVFLPADEYDGLHIEIVGLGNLDAKSAAKVGVEVELLKMLDAAQKASGTGEATKRLIKWISEHTSIRGRPVFPTNAGATSWMSGGAKVVEESGNTKLSKALSEVAARVGLKLEARPRRGTGHATMTSYTSIANSCPTSCALMGRDSQGGRRTGKDTSCYALMHKNIGPLVKLLNAVSDALDESAQDVAEDEAKCIEASFRHGVRGKIDFRMHTAGDSRTAVGSRMIAAATKRWQGRGGGQAWGYTHAWRDQSRSDFGVISTLASVQNVPEATLARRRGWMPTAVVKEGLFAKIAKENNGRMSAFRLAGDETWWIPCPAQNPDKNKQIACVNCRMCMNDHRYIDKGYGIAFEAHGSGAKRSITYVAGEALVSKMNAAGSEDTKRRLPVL